MAALGVSVVFLAYSREPVFSRPECDLRTIAFDQFVSAPQPTSTARVTIAGGGAAPVPAHPKPAPARRSISPLARKHMSLAQLARRKKERAERKKAARVLKEKVDRLQGKTKKKIRAFVDGERG
jgi:hypothetical protein